MKTYFVIPLLDGERRGDSQPIPVNLKIGRPAAQIELAVHHTLHVHEQLLIRTMQEIEGPSMLSQELHIVLSKDNVPPYSEMGNHRSCPSRELILAKAPRCFLQLQTGQVKNIVDMEVCFRRSSRSMRHGE